MQEHLNYQRQELLLQVRGRSFASADCERGGFSVRLGNWLVGTRITSACASITPVSLARSLTRSSSNYQLAQICFQSLCQTNLCTCMYIGYILTAYLNCALNSRSLARIRLSVSETHMVDVERRAINFADVTHI